MPYVPMRDQQKLYVRTIGRGRPVLMLPAWGMSSWMWLPFVLPFTRKFRFYMPEMRGHGKSIPVTLNQEDLFQNLAEDVHDLIEHFKLNDFLLVGISLGASVALHLQRETGLTGVSRYLHIEQSPKLLNSDDWHYGMGGERQPEFLKQMQGAADILMSEPDCSHFPLLPRPTKIRFAELLSESARIMNFGKATQFFTRNIVPRIPRVVGRMMPLMRLDTIAAYFLAYCKGGHDYRPTLSKGDTPVTVMIGERSTLYAVEGQELIAECASQSRIVRFKRSRHVLFCYQPVKFIREFSRFLHDEPS